MLPFPPVGAHLPECALCATRTSGAPISGYSRESARGIPLGNATSADGTVIEFDKVGSGPPLRTQELTDLLGRDDRRGRDGSTDTRHARWSASLRTWPP
ncbi:hypothetical protein [Amycolatopsis sp. A23]|uniref:hypothetical protein n=1 Tax=Amycolatopsis camponoti TaxID=2606593 RepID=UPI0012D718ED